MPHDPAYIKDKNKRTYKDRKHRRGEMWTGSSAHRGYRVSILGWWKCYNGGCHTMQVYPMPLSQGSLLGFSSSSWSNWCWAVQISIWILSLEFWLFVKHLCQHLSGFLSARWTWDCSGSCWTPHPSVILGFINSAGGDVPVSIVPAQQGAAHLRVTSMHAYEEKCFKVSAGC